MITRLNRVLAKDGLDADTAMLAFDVQDLAVMLYRAIRLATFQQQQLERLAAIVPEQNQAEAKMMAIRADEVAEAIAGEFLGWLGPEDAERLAMIATKSKG